MNVTLKPGLRRFVANQVKMGRYQNAGEVFSAALARLMQDEQGFDFAPGELQSLVDEGEADIERGDVFTLDQVRPIFQEKLESASTAKGRTSRRRRRN